MIAHTTGATVRHMAGHPAERRLATTCPVCREESARVPDATGWLSERPGRAGPRGRAPGERNAHRDAVKIRQPQRAVIMPPNSPPPWQPPTCSRSNSSKPLSLTLPAPRPPSAQLQLQRSLPHPRQLPALRPLRPPGPRFGPLLPRPQPRRHRDAPGRRCHRRLDPLGTVLSPTRLR